jgi:hypothetical protein
MDFAEPGPGQQQSSIIVGLGNTFQDFPAVYSSAQAGITLIVAPSNSS